MMMAFQEREILRLADDSCRWRVLYRSGEDTYLFSLDDRLALPEWRNSAQVEAEILSGHLINDGPGEPPELNASESKRAEERFKKFEPVLSDEKHADNVLTASGRMDAFKALKVFYYTLTRKVFIAALRSWWRGGKTDISLTDNYSNCGLRPIDRDDLEQVSLAEAKKHLLKRCLAIERSVQKPRTTLPDHTVDGMPRKRRAQIAPTTHRVDRLILRVFLEYYKWKKAEMGRSVRDAYKKMCAEVLVTSSRDGSMRAIAKRAHPRYHLFESWFYILNDYQTRRVAIRGEKGFGKKDREKTGNERSKVVRAAIRASGDATVWNVSIVTRLHGRRVIGPPLVFRIRCKRTGMLLGIAVSLANASWTLAAAAIANCVEDKVTFCKKYGLIIRPEDWPVCGLPAEFEFDRGETHNHGPEAFIARTGVRVKNLQGDRPDMKGGVESDFRTIEVRLTGKTPGACVMTWEQETRGEWKFKAELDIDQFTRLLLIHELDRMKQSRPGMNLPARMIAQGLTSSPLDFWRYSIQYEGASLTGWTLSEIQLLLMRRDSGTITERGIAFKGCVYLNEHLQANHEFAKARRQGRKSIDVVYDDRLVDQIYVTHIAGEELEQPLVCQLNDKLDHQLDYFGKCFAEVQELANKQALNDEAALQRQQDSTDATLSQHKLTLQEAREEKQAAPDHGSRAKQKREMPAARQQERNLDEPKKAFRPTFGDDEGREIGQTQNAPVPAANPPAGPVAPAPAAAPRKTMDRFLAHIKNLSRTTD